MPKQEVTLTFNQNDGLQHTRDLEELDVPEDLIEEATKNAKDINKIAKKYQFRCWYCLLFPIGIALIIIGNVLLPFPYLLVAVLSGVGCIIGMFILICVIQHKREKKLQETMRDLDEETNGVLRATPNYETRYVRTKNGTRTQRVLVSVKYSVIQARLQKYQGKAYASKNEPVQSQNFPIMSNPQQVDNAPRHNPSIHSQNGPYNPLNPNPQNININMAGANNPMYGPQLQFNPQGPQMQNPQPFQPFPAQPATMQGPNMNNPPFGNNMQPPMYGPLPQGLLKPNPNILNPNYQGPVPMGPAPMGNQLSMPGNNPNELVPFPNDTGATGITYNVNADKIDDYSAKQKY